MRGNMCFLTGKHQVNTVCEIKVSAVREIILMARCSCANYVWAGRAAVVTNVVTVLIWTI